MDSELALPSQWIAYKRGRLAVELLRPRLSGPGGLYNSGNLIGLSAGLALALNQSGALTLANAAHYFAGSADAICITVATLVFMVSGEAYHRAWAHGFPPVGRLNWWGDFLSGIGALWLGAALFLIGEPWLAATAGLMHAWGKFGSALQPPAAKWDWSRFHRLMVVLSRVPAMLATLLQIGGGLAGNEWGNLAAPAVLLACYLLWAKADLLLMKN
jgi:hypothetical protein